MILQILATLITYSSLFTEVHTLPLDHRGATNSYNILPTANQSSFLPGAGSAAPSSGGSSAGFSHNGRDTDSDNNRQRGGGGEYQTSSELLP